jgi:hypothetical protein
VVVDLESGGESVLDLAAERLSVRWSPNGEWLAWSSTPRPVDPSSAGIWAIRVADGLRRALSPDGAWVAWEADGETLVFARYGEHSGVWRVPLAGGEPERIDDTDRGMWQYLIYGLDVARHSGSMVVRLETDSTMLYTLDERH